MTFNSDDAQSSVGTSRQDRSSDREAVKLHRDLIKVIIHMTDNWIVEGFIHLPPSSRPLDLLNESAAAFLAVTEARMSNLEGQVRDLPFIAVSKAQIVRMFESE